MLHATNSPHPPGAASHDSPLITFAIFSFNQEKYIKQAVEGALSQTYSPLEVIISDDASSDSTPRIIRELVNQYRGPHKVVVNVNPSNLGIGRHVNKVFEMASGELLVLAAGDDISAPERVEVTAKRWGARKNAPSMIYCGANIIDAAGTLLGKLDTALPHMDCNPQALIEYSHPTKLLLMGACTSYARNLINEFGPLRGDLTVEDIPLAVRSSLLGGIECIDAPLVQYRRNVSVWLPRKLPRETFARHFRRMSHRVVANHLVSKQILLDSRRAGSKDATLSASNRYLSTRFTVSALRQRKFSMASYFMVAARSGYWRESLFPAILLGFPRTHRLIFFLASTLRKKG